MLFQSAILALDHFKRVLDADESYGHSVYGHFDFPALPSRDMGLLGNLASSSSGQ